MGDHSGAPAPGLFCRRLAAAAAFIERSYGSLSGHRWAATRVCLPCEVAAAFTARKCRAFAPLASAAVSAT